MEGYQQCIFLKAIPFQSGYKRSGGSPTPCSLPVCHSFPRRGSINCSEPGWMPVGRYDAPAMNKLPACGTVQSWKRQQCVSCHFSRTPPTLPLNDSVLIMRAGPVDLIQVHTFNSDARQAAFQGSLQRAFRKPPGPRKKLGGDQNQAGRSLSETDPAGVQKDHCHRFRRINKMDAFIRRYLKCLANFLQPIAMPILPDDSVTPLPCPQSHFYRVQEPGFTAYFGSRLLSAHAIKRIVS